jgi:hypothetical protein
MQYRRAAACLAAALLLALPVDLLGARDGDYGIFWAGGNDVEDGMIVFQAGNDVRTMNTLPTSKALKFQGSAVASLRVRLIVSGGDGKVALAPGSTLKFFVTTLDDCPGCARLGDVLMPAYSNAFIDDIEPNREAHNVAFSTDMVAPGSGLLSSGSEFALSAGDLLALRTTLEGFSEQDFQAAPGGRIHGGLSIDTDDASTTIDEQLSLQFVITYYPCFSVTPSSRDYGAAGGNGTFDLIPSTTGCSWTVANVPSWVTIFVGASGTTATREPESVRFGVAANAGSARTASFTVAGQPVSVSQAGAGALPHTVKGDFTGDGRADLAVFRPRNAVGLGEWRIDGLLPTVLGGAPMIPVPADYNGDGITDAALYQPERGEWWFKTDPMAVWGQPGDIPVPGNYVGDRRDEPAVFRPSSGQWFVFNQAAIQFGSPGDIPVPADYNGDGVTDLAVFRPSTGTWFIRGGAPIVWGRAGDIPVPADYDGNGRADVAVYRPATGQWFVLNGPTLQYGVPGDVPIPLDYDGDGAANFAVYRRSTGTAYIQGLGPGVVVGSPADLPVYGPFRHFASRDMDGDQVADSLYFDGASWLSTLSLTNPQAHGTFSFGVATDVRRMADFDGDGKADLVLYRPSTGFWYFAKSSTTFSDYVTFGPWGASGDIPLPADYDGDGKADIAVFRPATGRWYLRYSSTGFATPDPVDWGLSGDIPVPADYDGDGRADIAVFRPSNGRWYIRRSSDSTVQVFDWGAPGDVPAPADFDGDGRADLVIFRPSTGGWWIKQSHAEFTTYANVTFGATGDLPVPADYNGDGFADACYYRLNDGMYCQGVGRISAAPATARPVNER